MKKALLLSWLFAMVLGITVRSPLYAQGETVLSGLVTDTLNEPIVGAVVRLLPTGKTTVTDMYGKFSLKTQAGDESITVSFIGMMPETLSTAGTSTFKFRLKEKPNTVSDVVVVGYGQVRKQDVTGAIGSVKQDQIRQIATVDVAQTLQGRVAGVDVTAQSGEPGGGTRVRIRGVGTINSSDPLYVVDGFQVPDINFLSPNDIKSIEVLKDASASAIYGSRGANGVVLITTNRGAKDGKGKLTYETYFGTQTVRKQQDLTNAAEFSQLVMDAYKNDGKTLDPNSELANRLQFAIDNKSKGTNWQDQVLQRGNIQSHYLGYQGGSEKSSYSISANYFKQDGVIKNSGLEKFFVRFTEDLQLTNWLRAGINANFATQKKLFFNNDIYQSPLFNALRADPLTPVWDNNTNNWGRADISYMPNPARVVQEYNRNNGYENNLVANTFLEASFLKHFTFKTVFAATQKNIRNKAYFPEFFVTTDESRELSSLYERRGERLSWQSSNFLTYNQSFGKHNLTAMAGFEGQQSNYKDVSVTGYGVPDLDNLVYLSASQSTDFKVESSQNSESLLSYFGRANYNYDDKYMVTATIRRDGSSRFLAGERWGVFPSFALAWDVAQENFLKQIRQVSQLKFRFGYGQVGNQNSAPNYGYSTTLVNNNLYVFNNSVVQGFAPSRLSNPELKWEVTTSTNFGVDLGFFQNKLGVTADYFVRKTTDMIVAVPVPDYVGAEAPTVNAGGLQNKGLEAALSYRDKVGKLQYDFTLNYTRIRNEITDLGGGQPIAGGYIDKVGNTTLTEVGREIAYFYGLQTAGIFRSEEEVNNYAVGGTKVQPSAKPGDVKFVDQNADGKIDEKDRVYLGSAMPKYSIGFAINLRYEGFDFRIFFQGTQGNKAVNGATRYLQAGSNSAGSWTNFSTDRLDAWSSTNPNGSQPRMTVDDANNNMRFSDRYVEDASYLRVKNVQLGYTLPTSLTSKFKVQSLRLYISADNILTWTKYSGYDPEIGEFYYNPLYYGVDPASYPQAMTLRTGASITF